MYSHSVVYRAFNRSHPFNAEPIGRILNLKPVTERGRREKPSSYSQVNVVEPMADNRYCIEYAKTGRSSCKKCKSQIEKEVPRVGKITPNPFNDDGGDMKVWYHMRCIFETLKVSLTVCIFLHTASKSNNLS